MAVSVRWIVNSRRVKHPSNIFIAERAAEHDNGRKLRLVSFTGLVAFVAREYAELRGELSRINVGEPGYVGEVEVPRSATQD